MSAGRRPLIAAAFGMASALSLSCMLLGNGASMFFGGNPGDSGSPTPFLPASSTPTPFMPSLATQLAPFLQETPGAGEPLVPPTPYAGVPPWSPYAGPIYPAPTAIPSPAQPFELGDDVLNIALLGSDMRPFGSSYRTDTIMILSLNRSRGTATLISFPRDLYVYIPAYTMQRINVAFPIGYTLGYEGGSFGLFQDTMMYNFGLRVDHWVRVNFSGFTGLVDSLGGIDVPVAQTLTDKRKGYGDYTVYPGVVHMDGATALWYVRSRYSTSDFDRERRQQEVILGFANRLLSLNALANMPGFFDQLRQFVDMDLAFQDLAPFVTMATSVRPDNVRRYRIVSPAQCYGWITPAGADVQLPIPDAIRNLLQEALYP